jgi:hypothetical protein
MEQSRRDVIKLTLSAAANSRILAAGAAAEAILTGCSGSGNTGSSSTGGATTPTPTVSAPSNLSYSSPAQGTVGTALASLTPTVAGSVTSYSVSPALPAGLTLNASTGVISGTPTAAAVLTTYTITASNAGGSTSFALAITINGAIVISASTNTPTALTPVALTVVGLDLTKAFTVQLSNSSGYSAVLNPIRTNAANGIVVVAAPLYINPTTGTTGALTASLQITQGSLTSNALAWQIADLPSVASYGVNPGDISRGFFNAQSIYYGVTVNALQAMRALPTSKTNTSVVQAHLMTQQISTIEARSNADLIVSGSQTSLSVGTTTDGSPIAYDAHSLDIQDRIFGMYLQSIGYLPTTIYSDIPAVAKPPYVHQQTRNANRQRSTPLRHGSPYVGRAIASTKPLIDNSTARILPVPLRASDQAVTPEVEPRAITPAAIIDGLGYLGGAIGLTNAAIQANTATNSTDSAIAFGQGISTLAVVLGTLAASPELIAAATIVGTGYALAGLANDGYKWYTASDAVTAATDSGNAAALATAQKQLSDAQASFTLDAVGSVLGVFGLPTEIAGDVGLGAQVVTALTSAQTGLTGVAVQGLSLLTNVVGLAVTANGEAMSADVQSTQASNLEVPASSTSFGLIDGMVAVTDSNGPILSPLSGAYLTEPNTGTAFSTLAGADDNYSLIVPLDVPGYNYTDMSLEPYDPVSFETTGAPIVIDLATLTATTPLQVPTISGTCTDTDAGDPDEDDPDCD